MLVDVPRKKKKIYHPWNPKSDKHPISPYNITPESHFKVTRIQEMIANYGSSWLSNKFSLSVALVMYREQYGEYAYWCLGKKS